MAKHTSRCNLKVRVVANSLSVREIDMLSTILPRWNAAAFPNPKQMVRSFVVSIHPTQPR